jgi:hypothetical protein
MRNWRVVLVTALILGLAAAPLAGQVYAEEAGDSSPETPHTSDHPHAHKGMKKKAKIKSETKKADTAAEEGTSEPQSDSHGVHGSSFDDIEGSH